MEVRTMTLIEPMIFNEVTTAKTLIQGMIFNSAEKTHSNDTAKSPNTVNNNNQPATIIENNIQHTPQIIYTNTATALAAQIPNNHSQAMENSNLTVLKPNNTQIFPKKAQHMCPWLVWNVDIIETECAEVLRQIPVMTLNVTLPLGLLPSSLWSLKLGT